MLAGDLNITPQSQLLIELVNRARSNPVAEAALYGIGLNDDVPSDQTISSGSKQPLAPHQALVDAAMSHSADMLERDFFDHISPAPNSTTPSERAQAAGYPVGAGENIAWGGTTGSLDQNAEVYARHQGLFESVGHRLNMLYEPYREIGAGVQYGVFTDYHPPSRKNVDFNASMATEMFGSRGGNHFITGVAFDDSLVANDFYEIGEAVGGLTVRAVDVAGNVYETLVGDAGGYALQVPAGSYDVSFINPQTREFVVVHDVVVNGQNVKIDLDGDDVTWVAPLAVTARAFQGVASFQGGDYLQSADAYQIRYADNWVSVNTEHSYRLEGRARSGTDEGSQFTQENRQYFGFASYDSDQLLISPNHVSKYGNAVDTRLAVSLRPGDNEIVLQDSSGWANAGHAYQRTFAWYGYSNSQGYTYADYTYTRNVVSGLWNPGAIQGNTIILSRPWSGPELLAGTAVRNATSGASFNYLAPGGQAVPNEWREYSMDVSGVGVGNRQFRPGTAYIKPIALLNYHGNTGNSIRWENVQVQRTGPAVRFMAGTVVGARADVQYGGDEAISYHWTQLSGPSVDFSTASESLTEIRLPASQEDVQVVLQVAVTVEGVTATDILEIPIAGVAAFNAVSVLDATKFLVSQETLAVNGGFGIHTGNDFIPVDPGNRYLLKGQARSGNNAGGQFTAENVQYFGFANYDADKNLIMPWQVLKFPSAADTVLAAPLQPGDQKIVLQNAMGWANGGAPHQRSIAWYGYANRNGYVYPNFSYTRNVAIDFRDGLWDSNGISGNVISLRKPWAGPALKAGTAVRNSSSGGTFNYAALNGQAIANQWTDYQVTLGGTGLGISQFRPGTAFVKPIALTNYQGYTDNLIRWKNVSLRYVGFARSYAAGTTIDLQLDNLDGDPAATYRWTQISGPELILENSSLPRISIDLPASATDYQLTFQVEKTLGEVVVADELSINVHGSGKVDAIGMLDASTFHGESTLTNSVANGLHMADNFTAVDPSQKYRLVGESRSGNDFGGQYFEENRQYFGFASYDADQRLIEPWHVSKYGNAADTVLVVPLRPGDTRLVLEDASNWANGGTGIHRALAWYGYTNDFGFTYPDYTYTRNIARDFSHGLWDAGAIEGNSIQLRRPWDGPVLAAGTAVRNATGGPTFNYVALPGRAVSGGWTRFEATLSGTGLATTQFRPGTAFVKPVVLSNYHGNAANLVRWRSIELRHDSTRQSYFAGTTVDLGLLEEDPRHGISAYHWEQTSGPIVGLFGSDSSQASVSLPLSGAGYEVTFQVTRSTDGVEVSDTLSLQVLG